VSLPYTRGRIDNVQIDDSLSLDVVTDVKDAREIALSATRAAGKRIWPVFHVKGMAKIKNV
jgi:hypothetical protein